MSRKPWFFIYLLTQALACASPGSVKSLTDFYADENGLRVATASVETEVSPWANTLLSFQGLWDRIWVDETQASSGSSGHHHHASARSLGVMADGVEGEDHDHDHGAMGEDMLDGSTGASIRAATGDDGATHRYEGAIGVTRQVGHGATPYRFGAQGRLSYESDYVSLTGIVNAASELFERNTLISGYLGFGKDRILPNPEPPGEQSRWPADQRRYLLGFGITQMTGKRSQILGGYSLTVLSGALEGPYRRTTVITTLFPERLPDTRLRNSVVTGWSYTPWNGTALHLRQGLYFDSWGILSWIPEIALAQEMNALLLRLSYRHTDQTRADFWEHHYTALEGWRTGDFRLDGLAQDAVSLEAKYRIALAKSDIDVGVRGMFFSQKAWASGVDPRGFTLGAHLAYAW